MFLVTGGAGFIGSNLVSDLVDDGHEVVVCDRLRTGEKWRNIAKSAVSQIVSPEHLPEWLKQNFGKVDSVFHLGAISATTETDVDRIVLNNIEFSHMLWNWCTEHAVPLVYASSAATYGNGDLGFGDSDHVDYLSRLRPLNPYGWSKALFDIQARRLSLSGICPPVWVGLKFFNVYGPNEYHKGAMRSAVVQMFEKLNASGSVRLFRSARADYADGGQKRDFVWVGDCVSMMKWAASQERFSGILNCGSGHARCFVDLADAVFASTKRRGEIEWVDTPPAIARHYQYFTEADMTRARAAGYIEQATALEDGVSRYIRDYLMQEDRYV